FAAAKRVARKSQPARIVFCGIEAAFWASTMKTACVTSSASCALATCRSATAWTMFTCRSTSVRNACSEWSRAYSRNRAMSSACITGFLDKQPVNAESNKENGAELLSCLIRYTSRRTRPIDARHRDSCPRIVAALYERRTKVHMLARFQRSQTAATIARLNFPGQLGSNEVAQSFTLRYCAGDGRQRSRRTRQFLEQLHRFIGDAFACAGLGVTVKAGPGLVAAEAVAFAVRQVANPVVGQFGHERVRKRRTAFDIHAERSEILRGHADDCHVPDDHRLQIGRAFLALVRLQLAARRGEDLADARVAAFGVCGGVTLDLRVFLGFVERADPIGERPFDRRDAADGAACCLRAGVEHRALEPFDGDRHRHA